MNDLTIFFVPYRKSSYITGNRICTYACICLLLEKQTYIHRAVVQESHEQAQPAFQEQHTQLSLNQATRKSRPTSSASEGAK